jgi:hypothetical protein
MVSVVAVAASGGAHAGAALQGQPGANRAGEPASAASAEDDADDDDEDDDDGDSGDTAANPIGNDGAKPVPADHEVFEVGSELELVSRYVWRGKALSQRPAFEPEVWASYRSFTASVWANLLLTQEAGWRRLSAFEPSLSYTVQWRPVTIEPHVTRYWFLTDRATNTTTELGVNLTVRTGPLFWTTTQDFDVEEARGAYYGTIGGGARKRYGPWSAKVAADVAWATATFNEAYWGRSVSAIDLVEGTAEVRYRLTPLLTAALQGALSTLISPDLRAATTEPTLATVGLVFGVNR